MKLWIALMACLLLVGCGKKDDTNVVSGTGGTFGPSGSSTSPAGADTPEQTVNAFADAFSRGEVTRAASYVEGAQPSQVSTEMEKQFKEEPVTILLSEVKSTITGESAEVTAQVETRPTGANARIETGTAKVPLKKVNGKWLIVPMSDSQAQTQSMPKDLMNRLAFVLTHPEVLIKARSSARAIACLSNVKQISTGAMMYTQDYDEVMPRDVTDYKQELMPYIKNEAVFKCPADESGTLSYSFNSNLAKVSMATVKAPAKTVMLYEGKDNKLEYRHDGKAVIGFADGHVKRIGPEEATELVWKP